MIFLIIFSFLLPWKPDAFNIYAALKVLQDFLFSPSFPYADYIMKLPPITFIDINRHSLLHIWHLLSTVSRNKRNSNYCTIPHFAV